MDVEDFKNASMNLKEFKKSVPESDHLKACLDLLSRLGFVVWRSNAGGSTFRHQYKKGIRKRLIAQYHVRFGFKGLPDICGYIKGGQSSGATPFFWEVKRHKGKIKPEQKTFIETAKRHGAFAGVGTIDDLIEDLRNSGYL